MVTVKFFNENGNVSVKVRDGIRPQVLTKVFNILSESGDLEGVVRNANGGISIPIATDESGAIVYAHFDMSISTKSPTDKIVRNRAEKKVEEEAVVPTLFD